MLITHRGLSGPAILQTSSYWNPGTTVEIDLAPEADGAALLLEPGARRDAGLLRFALRGILPARFADRWMELAPPSGWSNNALAEWEQTKTVWICGKPDTKDPFVMR